MQTEELARREHVADPQEVSSALLDLYPSRSEIVDARHKRTPLSSAGYVLHFRRSYEVRVAGRAGGGPAPELRLTTWPAFIEPKPGSHAIVKHGREYRCLPFDVKRPTSWLKFYTWPYEVLSGDAHVECTGPDSKAVDLVLPVVARSAWGAGIVILLVSGALGGWILGQLFLMARAVAVHGGWPGGNLAELWTNLQTGPHPWLWPTILALAALPTAWLWTAWQLWERRRCLRRGFEERVGRSQDGHQT